MPEAFTGWFDLFFKVFALAATLYWLVWHRREGRRMVREEDRLWAAAGDVQDLEKRVERCAPKDDHEKLEAEFKDHQRWIMSEIDKVYKQMKEDANSTAAQIREQGQAVTTTLRNMSETIGRIVGRLEALTK